jgi:flagellum-specific ATP synthase
MAFLDAAAERVELAEPLEISGRVAVLRGLSVLVDDLAAGVGSLVRVGGRGGQAGEVVGFDRGRAIVMLLGSATGIRAGDRVTLESSHPWIGVSRSLMGRVVNAMGAPIDGGPMILDAHPRRLVAHPMSAMRRPPIHARMQTGVRAMDVATTVGRGQRLGIFAGPGVGKSTLLSMLARNADADAIVIALIGERGREVRDFIDHALGREGMRRTVVVVATSDESPLMRVRAAHAASTIAERFREEGDSVMLMVDSVTRFAHAQRQIGLAVGEPPATRGYTPSVFAALPVLLERAGTIEPRRLGERPGSITAFYTVLVEGDDMTEPIADAVRGILDGHIILSRTLAQQGHFPAIDVLDSVSRLADAVSQADHVEHRRELVRLIAAYRQVEDLVQIGAYSVGSNARADKAIALKARIDALLQQKVDEPAPFADSVARLREVVTAPVPPPGGRR